MTALHTVYVTAHGEWTATPWVGEFAQIGIRLALETEGSLPAKGSQFAPSNVHGDVVVDSGSTSGTHGALARTWSARLGAVGSSENADAAWQVDLAEDFWTFLNAAKVVQSNKFRWTHVKVAPIAENGKYCAPGAIYQFTTALVGGDTNPAMPPEVALALSLRAGVIGRRGRGRMYLPAIGMNLVDTNGTADVTTRASLAGYVKTFIDNLENAPGTEVITPLVVVTSAGSPIAVRPSEVRVGSHFDVQRRRQAQVAESYSITAI